MPASQVHRRGPTTPELNMTPLIDVTFLLIIFFMLISNFIAEETVEMIVPDLDEPKVRQLEEMKRVVVNVAPMPYSKDDRNQRFLDWPGEAQFVNLGGQRYAMQDMDQVTADLSSLVDAAPKDEKGQSTLEVLLRADAALYYQEVQPVMVAITSAGVGTVHLVSYLPEQGPRRKGVAP
ncbi:MAG: hypothetical protein CMJ18_24735 [Phycisphaeraceae bacterium]|nr:hypothetical protein [Phycisphaeraceae bacterium]